MRKLIYNKPRKDSNRVEKLIKEGIMLHMFLHFFPMALSKPNFKDTILKKSTFYLNLIIEHETSLYRMKVWRMGYNIL